MDVISHIVDMLGDTEFPKLKADLHYWGISSQQEALPYGIMLDLGDYRILPVIPPARDDKETIVLPDELEEFGRGIFRSEEVWSRYTQLLGAWEASFYRDIRGSSEPHFDSEHDLYSQRRRLVGDRMRSSIRKQLFGELREKNFIKRFCMLKKGTQKILARIDFNDKSSWIDHFIDSDEGLQQEFKAPFRQMNVRIHPSLEQRADIERCKEAQMIYRTSLLAGIILNHYDPRCHKRATLTWQHIDGYYTFCATGKLKNGLKDLTIINQEIVVASLDVDPIKNVSRSDPREIPREESSTASHVPSKSRFKCPQKFSQSGFCYAINPKKSAEILGNVTEIVQATFH